MAHAKIETIYLLVTDLAASNPRDFKIPRFSTLSTKLSLRHVAFSKHWAIRVRDFCYEVNSRPSQENPKKSDFYLDPGMNFDSWKERANASDSEWEEVEVGETTWSHRDIVEHSKLIWQDRFDERYKLHQQNCQNFCYLLYQAIAVEPDKIKKDIQRSFKHFPKRFSEIAHFAKTTLASGIARAVLFELATDALIFGIELVGLEALLSMELIGLEIAGVALLGPIGEVVFAIVVIAFILKKSRDKKWHLKFKKMAQRNKTIPDNEGRDVQPEQGSSEQKRVEVALNQLALEAESRLRDPKSEINMVSTPEQPMEIDQRRPARAIEAPPDLRAKLKFNYLDPDERPLLPPRPSRLCELAYAQSRSQIPPSPTHAPPPIPLPRIP